MTADGTVHLLTCTTRLGDLSTVDSNCTRCKAIKRVVFLHRKARGGFVAEARSARLKADELIETYRLTRGEVFDREYEVVPTAQEERQAARQRRSRQKIYTAGIDATQDEMV